MLFLVLAAGAYAQTSDTAGSRPPHRELELYASYQRLRPYSNLANAGLWFWMPLSHGRSLKFGAAYLRYNDRGDRWFAPATGYDSIYVDWTFREAHIIALGIGLEQERTVTRCLTLYAGAEVRAGYGFGKEGYASTTESRPVSSRLPSSFPEPQGTGWEFRAALGQARGYVGIRSDFRRVRISLETGGFFNALRRTYGGYPGGATASVNDLVLGIDYRASVGIRL